MLKNTLTMVSVSIVTATIVTVFLKIVRKGQPKKIRLPFLHVQMKITIRNYRSVFYKEIGLELE